VLNNSAQLLPVAEHAANSRSNGTSGKKSKEDAVRERLKSTRKESLQSTLKESLQSTTEESLESTRKKNLVTCAEGEKETPRING